MMLLLLILILICGGISLEWKRETDYDVRRLVAGLGLGPDNSSLDVNGMFGKSVALSSDGQTALLGKIGAGHGGGGAAYVASRSDTGPWQVTAKLSAGDGNFDSLFGSAVALNDAGDLAIVGAPSYTSGLLRHGAAYIFSRGTSNWSAAPQRLQGKVDAGAEFGSAVALSSDGLIAVIGAKAERPLAENTRYGSIYIFTRIDGNAGPWSLLSKVVLTEDDREAYAGFGHAVSMAADGSVLFISAYAEDAGGLIDAGVVYVLERSLVDPSRWEKTAKLRPNDARQRIFFGFSVSASDDGNTVVIGAHLSPQNGELEAGSSYVFTRSAAFATDWSHLSLPVPPSVVGRSNFGLLVDVSGDSRVALVGSASKFAYIYGRSSRTATDWSLKQVLASSRDQYNSAPVPYYEDAYGRAGALSSNGSVCVVGDMFAQIAGKTRAGAAFFYTQVANQWVFTPPALTGGDGSSHQSAFYFGDAVVLSDDGTVALVGSPYNRELGLNAAGSAYVFSRPSLDSTEWRQEAKLLPGNGSRSFPGAYFGSSVALSANADIAFVGAPGHDQVFVYFRAANRSTWIESPSILTGTSLKKGFGVSIALSSNGEYALIGTEREYFGGRWLSVVYLFQSAPMDGGFNATRVWRPIFLFGPPEDIQQQQTRGYLYFGSHVALSSNGSMALVGAHGYDEEGSSDVGLVYAYRKDEAGLWWRHRLDSELAHRDQGHCGFRVAVSGDASRALVGCGGAQTGNYVLMFALDGNATYRFHSQLSAEGTTEFRGHEPMDIALSRDGSAAMVSVRATSRHQKHSAAFVYRAPYEAGIVEAQEEVIDSASLSDFKGFGSSCALSGDGNLAVVGSIGGNFAFLFCSFAPYSMQGRCPGPPLITLSPTDAPTDAPTSSPTSAPTSSPSSISSTTSSSSSASSFAPSGKSFAATDSPFATQSSSSSSVALGSSSFTLLPRTTADSITVVVPGGPTTRGDNADITRAPNQRDSPDPAGMGTDVVAVLVVVVVLMVLLASIALAWFLGRWRRWRGEGAHSSTTTELQIRDKAWHKKIKKTKFWIGAGEVERLEQIGEGAFGVVYRGRWRGTVDVAIKELKATGAVAVDRREFGNLIREAEHMHGLRPHPNVVQIYGVCGKPTLSLLVQYCARGALVTALYGRAATALDQAQLQSIAVDVASGMAHLHAEGVIHRDLAARNVLLDSEGRALVGDFGMARLTDRAGSDNDDGNDDKNDLYTHTTTGPLRWMAPEQMMGERMIYSRHSDVWSYGVLLYEIFARQRPWTGKSNQQAAFEVMSGRSLEAPASAPRLARQTMEQCFARQPKQRPTMQQIALDLRKAWIDGGDDIDQPGQDEGQATTAYGSVLLSTDGGGGSTGVYDGVLPSESDTSSAHYYYVPTIRHDVNSSGATQGSTISVADGGAGSAAGRNRRASKSKNKTGKSKVGKSNAGKSKAGKSKAGKSNAGKSNAGKSNAGKSNVGKSKAGNSNAGNSNAGNNNVGKSKATRSPADNGKKRVNKPAKRKASSSSSSTMMNLVTSSTAPSLVKSGSSELDEGYDEVPVAILRKHQNKKKPDTN